MTAQSTTRKNKYIAVAIFILVSCQVWFGHSYESISLLIANRNLLAIVSIFVFIAPTIIVYYLNRYLTQYLSVSHSLHTTADISQK